MRNGDFSPPGRRKRVYARLRPAMAATLPSRGGMRPPVSRSLQPQAIMLSSERGVALSAARYLA
jgi:hypothetical protein